MKRNEDQRVVVVTGVGGMGLACAQRLGIGSTVVLADVNPTALHTAAEELANSGQRGPLDATLRNELGSRVEQCLLGRTATLRLATSL